MCNFYGIYIILLLIENVINFIIVKYVIVKIMFVGIKEVVFFLNILI